MSRAVGTAQRVLKSAHQSNREKGLGAHPVPGRCPSSRWSSRVQIQSAALGASRPYGVGLGLWAGVVENAYEARVVLDSPFRRPIGNRLVWNWLRPAWSVGWRLFVY